MGSRRRRDRQELETNLALLRRMQLRQWNQLYAPTVDRLDAAYAETLAAIDATTIDSTAIDEFSNVVRSEFDNLIPLIRNEARIQQRAGVNVGARAGATSLRNGGMEYVLNTGTIEQLQATIDIVDREAFIARTAQFGEYHSTRVRSILISANAQGLNPRDTAELIDAYLRGQGAMPGPRFDMERFTRTAQIWASRTATQRIYADAGVEEWIWSANLGSPRTCMSCIAMHGTRHPVSEVLNDHHAGRCVAVPVTPSWRDTGFSSGGEPEFETGTQWFERQPADVQQRVLGRKLYAAYEQGRFAFTPDVISIEYEDDIYGTMRRPNTAQDILGD